MTFFEYLASDSAEILILIMASGIGAAVLASIFHDKI